MNKHVEKEYKMLVSKEQFDKLCSLYENLNFITQTNTYYDTVNGDIQKKKGAMRIRERNGRFLFTLKMRQENLDGLCECECEVSENSVHALQSEEIVQLLHEYQIEAAIIPLTTLVTKRAVVETENAELCFDISTYGSHTDYEIEYEYKQPHDGLSVWPGLRCGAGAHRAGVPGGAACPRRPHHAGGQYLQHGHRRASGLLGCLCPVQKGACEP